MKPALILGGASCLRDDLATLEALIGRPWPWTVFAVNDSGWDYSRRIHYWVSLHQPKMPDWMEKRRANGYPMKGIKVWGGSWITKQDDSKLPWVDHVLPVAFHGSSGSHAVEIALHLGHDRVIGAGMPMDMAAHFNRTGPWVSALFHREGIERAAERWHDRVRFVSGWTAELFGEPTLPWLKKPAYLKAS